MSWWRTLKAGVDASRMFVQMDNGRKSQTLMNYAINELVAQRDVSGYTDQGTSTAPSTWLVNHLTGGATSSGMAINERTAEGIPAIYACVHVISETVGQLPLKLYRKSGNGKQPDPDHPLYAVLHDLANPNLTALQFREMMTRHLAIWGRAYAFIERDARGVKALWPLHPMRMFVEYDALNRKVFQYWVGRGEYREWIHNPDRPDVMHLHINSDDGLDGRSPLVINRDSLGITKAADDYVGSFFGSGAVPAMILRHPGKLSENAKENLRKSWLEKFMGAKNAHKMAILQEGIELEIVGQDAQKSQLEELRRSQIEAAARIYRVPLFLIQNQTKDTSWGSGIEQQMLGFVNLTMMPWLQQWQQVISRDLLNRQSANSHEAIFIVNSLVRGDLKTRVESYASARQNGWMNGDEIRELEDMNPIPNGVGKTFWMASGAQPLMNGGLPVLVEEDEPKPIAKGSEAVN
jgi:HK97 family phage portal protein